MQEVLFSIISSVVADIIAFLLCKKIDDLDDEDE